MKNFRRILTGINVAPLLDQLRDVPTAAADEEAYPYDPHHLMWRKTTEWTHKKRGLSVYHEDNIVLRYLTMGVAPPSLRLYLSEEDGRSRQEWTRPAAAVLTAAWPIVWDVMRALPGEHLGHVIITRLPPYGEITPHVDRWPPELGAPYWQRHQVPLSVGSDCRFRCGDEGMWLEPGSAYWFNNQVEHSVHNGDHERITMIVDIRPIAKEFVSRTELL